MLTLRRVALCLAAIFTCATVATAQSAPDATVARSAAFVATHDENAVLTALRSPVFKRLHPELERFAVNRSDHSFGQQSLKAGDSLKNGAIIGTLIGAAGFGAFAAVLCHAYQEEDGASCLPDTLRFAAIGGAIGGGLGLAIDASRHDRGINVRVAIRF